MAARHLHHFGYVPSVCYPRRTDKQLYRGLATQLESLGIPFLSAAELEAAPLAGRCATWRRCAWGRADAAWLPCRFDLAIDALFGFSFRGAPRPPFDALLQLLSAADAPPVASIDVPSGALRGRGCAEEKLRALRSAQVGTWSLAT